MLLAGLTSAFRGADLCTVFLTVSSNKSFGGSTPFFLVVGSS